MKYFFTKNESDQINRKKGLQRIKEFFKIWTQKEAVVKMFGMGISHIKQEEYNSNYIIQRIIPHKKYVGAISHEY
jgi:phosphopantetheine--protein transferase-like protein